MQVTFVLIRRFVLAHVILSSLITVSHRMYFELLGFSVFHVVCFIHSLLLYAFVKRRIRDRTGAVWVGAGLGGIEVIF